MINEMTYHWSTYYYFRQLTSKINHSLLGYYHSYGCQEVLTLFSKSKSHLDFQLRQLFSLHDTFLWMVNLCHSFSDGINAAFPLTLAQIGTQNLYF